MKLDVIIVRILPIILYLFIGISIVMSYLGIYLDYYYYLHSNSVIYSFALFIISLSNKRYHCVYNRVCYVMLFFIPIFNFLDAKYDFVPHTMLYVGIVFLLYILGLLSTLYLSIIHFIQSRKRIHAKSQTTTDKAA